VVEGLEADADILISHFNLLQSPDALPGVRVNFNESIT